jgi:DNA repair photolyase
MQKKCATTINRKSLLYKTAVEYGDYTINHVEGCSHGCLYPCYAMMMAKRFGKVKSYDEWIEPKIVSNSVDLLRKEIPKNRDKIKFVHLCFSTDPFMYGYQDISDLSVYLIKMLNDSDIRCTALTKGILPKELSFLSKKNEFGISLISLDESFRNKYEPGSAPYDKRIDSLRELHKKGIQTWVSIEPYPTPNIVSQNLLDILKTVSFVDKIIFGRLNYNAMVTKYPDYKSFYNELSKQVVDFCASHKIGYHIKKGTVVSEVGAGKKTDRTARLFEVCPV